MKSRTVAALVGVAVVLLLLTLEAGYGFAHPLRSGSVRIPPQVCANVSDEATCVARKPKPGERFVFAMTLSNYRPLPITVVGASLGDQTFAFVDELRLLPNQPTAVGFGGAVPFKPFGLASGAERTLVVIAHTTTCAKVTTDGSSLTLPGLTVRFRWLAITHEQVVSSGRMLTLPYREVPC